MTDTVAIVIVNHVAVDIACDPGSVWALIDDEYRYGGKFRRAGYGIIPLTDDPAAWLGGYRMALGDGQDARVCRVTEHDPASMRLSLHAVYLDAAAEGMTVHATYRVEAVEGGARYTIDSYATRDIALPAPGVTVAEVVGTLTTQFDAALRAYLAEIEARLSAGA